MDSVIELKNKPKENFPSNADTFKKMFKTSQQFETKRKLLKMAAPNP
jgi:selenophosphate synthetase-related protein